MRQYSILALLFAYPRIITELGKRSRFDRVNIAA